MRSRPLYVPERRLRALRAGSASCFVLIATSLFAEAPPETDPAQEPGEMEEVLVTGTRIKRVDIEGALPVTTIDRETIERSGDSALAEFVRSLSFNTHGSYRTQFDGMDMGTAQVSLRGLGSGRSLVLVDGRRLVKAPRSTIYQDLNVIPMGSVERIEVLSDGASAVYGSDAIAGVINIITRDDYRGFEFEYGRAHVDPEGGDRDWGSLVFGHAGERWKLQVTYSWNSRDFIFNRDFDWFEPVGSIEANNFTTLDPETLYPAPPPFNLTAIPGGCGGSEAFSIVPFPLSLSGDLCLYADGIESTSEPSLDTQGALVKFDYQLGVGWTAWLVGSWSETEASGQQDALAWSSEIFGYFGLQWPLPEWSPNNPTNPDSAMHDPAFGPNVPVHYYHRFETLGNYRSTWTTELEDLQLGATGRLGAVELDFGLRTTHSRTDDLTVNLDPFTSHALIVDGSYDLQNPAAASGAMLETMRMDQLSWWEYDQDEVFATAAWDLFSIGGAPVKWLVGGEYREEDWASEIVFLGPAGGQRDVLALYFESLLPLGSKLELSLAGRYDDYSDWGDNFSPKLSLRWNALDDWILRASWGEGFRAPELSILGVQTRQSFELINDPPSCSALDWPPDCEIPYLLVHTVSEALGPERSDQYTLGVVWEPSPRFNLVLDYYEIELRDEISEFWPELLLYFDYSGTSMPAGLSVERDPATGVLRSITAGWGNQGRVNTTGLDLTVNLEFPLGAGRWHSNLLLTHMLKDEWNGWDALKYAGLPDTRGTLTNVFTIADFTFSWNVHYISSHDRALEGQGDNIPSWSTHDLQAAWSTPWNGTVVVGAQNIFNEQPHLDEGLDYDTTLYDPYGRIVYAEYRQYFR